MILDNVVNLLSAESSTRFVEDDIKLAVDDTLLLLVLLDALGVLGDGEEAAGAPVKSEADVGVEDDTVADVISDSIDRGTLEFITEEWPLPTVPKKLN